MIFEIFEERESILWEFAEGIVLECGVPESKSANSLVEGEEVRVDLLNGPSMVAMNLEEREELVVVILSTRHFVKHLPPIRLILANKSK